MKSSANGVEGRGREGAAPVCQQLACGCILREWGQGLFKGLEPGTTLRPSSQRHQDPNQDLEPKAPVNGGWSGQREGASLTI